LRTALSLFAVGWVLLQTAAGHLLLLAQFGGDLDPVFVQLVKLVLTLAYGVGAVYFLTGMAMSCTVPADTGAKRFAWGIVACLVLSGAAWLLFDAAAYHNEQIVEELGEEIRQAQRENPKAEPPSREKLEQELLARQWSQDLLKALAVAFVGAFCLAKLLFTVLLWTVARYLRQSVLAAGLLIYLLGESLAVAMALSTLTRQPARLTMTAPFTLFTGNWYSVAAASAFCAWFVVNLFLLRRAITRAAEA
jgi:hypothetical protein